MRRIPTQGAWFARFGPRTDELTTMRDDTLAVWSFDGSVRREYRLDPAQTGVEPLFDPTTQHAIVSVGDDLHVIDLVTMKQRLIARDTWGPASGSRDGSIYAYLDRDRRVHLIDITGKQVAMIADSTARAQGVVFAPEGDRLGVIGDDELAIYDAAGAHLGTFPIEREQSTFLLRGDDAWIGGNAGVVRHYKGGELVASIPAHATEIATGALGGDALALLGGDASLVVLRASTEHVRYADAVCAKPSYTSYGIATGYECDGVVKLYLGREHIADYPPSEIQLAVAYDRASQRAAVSGASGVHVFERGKPIAKTARRGAAAFEDAGHVWLVEPAQGLWRWTLAGDGWDKLADITNAYAVAALPGKVVLGTQDGTLIVLAGRREVARVAVGEQVIEIVPAWDHRWLAVHLASGVTAIVDTGSWRVARKLAAADNSGAAATFDATGELLLRSSRNALTIWDRATGEELVFGFDLLHDLASGRFLPDGRIELNRRMPGLLDIPRDTRPISEILADIDCKVPLEVVGSRIEPRSPRCP